ncbi:MAG: aminotransferase class I/II-fold pyridoxal phosphate-dependent enzyme, partial [Myxococcota bacterium]|nr:aminotransferase class I/II-fold pyridoxal phosphate-dependent enzyme [Myxococcota bacterium]
MSPSEQLNKRLQGAHSGAARCLSDLGRRLFFPQGIPAQTAEAAGCQLNATIGQVTDGKGRPLPLPSMSRHMVDLDSAQVFLYARQGGLPALRRAWAQRIRGRHPSAPAMGLPLVTHGLTHGLSLVSDLFVDETADVLLPSPGWGNYHHIFGTRRGGRLVPYALFEGRGAERFFSVSGLERALGEVRD